MTAGTSEMHPCCAAYLGYSVWSIADDVSWRIVVAHPDLPTPIGGDGAAHCSCRAPYDLRVMAADAGAGIAANIISLRPPWPSSLTTWAGDAVPPEML